MTAKYHWLLLTAALLLVSCAQSPPGPQMKSPHRLHSQVKLDRRINGPASLPYFEKLKRGFVFVLREKGRSPRTVAYPADAAVAEEVLNSGSNFDLSEGMMLDLADILFGSMHSLSPEGNRYRREGDQARIQTVSSDGTLWQITVTGRKEAGWKVKIDRKSREGKYGGLAEVF